MDTLIEGSVTSAMGGTEITYRAKLDGLRRSLPTPTQRSRMLDFRIWSKSIPVSPDPSGNSWRLAKAPRRVLYDIRQGSKVGHLVLYSSFVRYAAPHTTGTLMAALFTTPVTIDPISGHARATGAKSINTELVDRLQRGGVGVDVDGNAPTLTRSPSTRLDARLDGPDRIAVQAPAPLPPAAYLDHVSNPAILSNTLLRFFVEGSASEPSALAVASERPQGQDHSPRTIGGPPASEGDEVEPSERRPPAVLLSGGGAPTIALDGDQHTACAMAFSHRACLIKGPPGTGKSQVIAAIAERAAATGRSVLITSTERSAIDVARRRAGHIAGVHIATLVDIARSPPSTIGEPDFDLVVIDEASRMALASAATVIVRARSLTVIGDDRQLRPEDESETILDLAIRTGLPQITLRFHYRSKDRTLIMPSNLMSYDMKLRTVPTPPLAPTNGLKLAYMTGKQRSTSRGTENHQEANFVIKLLKGLGTEKTARSIAVVTANTTQAALIEKMIATDLSKHQQAALSRVEGEPLLVCAAQDMQGEERDVVLASMVYDSSASRFGLFDKANGMNLANVMLSRSREEMTVLMSYRPTAQGMAMPATRGKIIYSFLYSCMDVAATTETRQKPPACFSALASRLDMRIDHLGVVLGLRTTLDDRYRVGLIPISPAEDSQHWDGIEAQLVAVGWTVMRVTEERCRLHQTEVAAEIRRLLATAKQPQASPNGRAPSQHR